MTMQKFDVQIALEKYRAAKAEWTRGLAEFNSNGDAMLSRLLHEAARCFMSPEEFARHSGLTPKRVRLLMRSAGLDPRAGKRLLSKKAAEALENNAALLGIEPHEMDLTSPLAYLPMGKEMRKELRDAAIHGVTELENEVSGNSEVAEEVARLRLQIHDMHLRSKGPARLLFRVGQSCPACGLTA